MRYIVVFNHIPFALFSAIKRAFSGDKSIVRRMWVQVKKVRARESGGLFLKRRRLMTRNIARELDLTP